MDKNLLVEGTYDERVRDAYQASGERWTAVRATVINAMQEDVAIDAMPALRGDPSIGDAIAE